ncbi:hypothetical protein STEG23_009218 [Scotinomys teguina]
MREPLEQQDIPENRSVKNNFRKHPIPHRISLAIVKALHSDPIYLSVSLHLPSPPPTQNQRPNKAKKQNKKEEEQEEEEEEEKKKKKKMNLIIEAVV